MTIGPFFFHSHRYESGYRWLRVMRTGEFRWEDPPANLFEPEVFRRLSRDFQRYDKPNRGYYLVNSKDASKEARVSLRPLEEDPYLFLKFAQEPLTPTRVLDFTNQWGFLDSENPDWLWQVPDPEDSHETITVAHEPAYSFFHSHRDMKFATDVWLRLGDNKRLRKYLEPHLDWLLARIGHESFPSQGALTFEDYVAGRPTRIPHLSRQRQTEIVNEIGLDNLARTAIEIAVNGSFIANLGSRLLWDAEQETWRNVLVPSSLHMALVFQLVESISKDSEFRRCMECNGWMEISPSVGRPEKTYCSDACRMRAYRKRKAGKK